MMFGIPGIWGGFGFDVAAATIISQTGVWFILALDYCDQVC